MIMWGGEAAQAAPSYFMGSRLETSAPSHGEPVTFVGVVEDKTDVVCTSESSATSQRLQPDRSVTDPWSADDPWSTELATPTPSDPRVSPLKFLPLESVTEKEFQLEEPAFNPSLSGRVDLQPEDRLTVDVPQGQRDSPPSRPH